MVYAGILPDGRFFISGYKPGDTNPDAVFGVAWPIEAGGGNPRNDLFIMSARLFRFAEANRYTDYAVDKDDQLVNLRESLNLLGIKFEIIELDDECARELISMSDEP